MPAAPAIAEGVAAVYSIFEGVNSSNQQGKAEQAAQSNQNALLTDAVKTAQNPTPYLNAEKGAAETLKSNIGGVANPGAEIQALYGNDLSQALNASLNATTGADFSAAGQYGGIAANAGKAQSASAGSLTAGVGAAANAFNALTRAGKPAGGTGTATGLGSTDVNVPPGFSTTPTGFTDTSGPTGVPGSFQAPGPDWGYIPNPTG